MNLRMLLALVVMVTLVSLTTLGCGGSSETTVPPEAANVQQAPTDDPAQEDAAKLAEGP